MQHFQNKRRYNAGPDTLYKTLSVAFEYLSLTFEKHAPLDEIQFKLKLTSHSHFQLDRVNAQRLPVRKRRVSNCYEKIANLRSSSENHKSIAWFVSLSPQYKKPKKKKKRNERKSIY